MATFTETTTPVVVVRGRPFLLPVVWQTAALPPVPINIGGYVFAGVVIWTQNNGDPNAASSADLSFATTSAANGEFNVLLDADTTGLLPQGSQVATMGITLTDGAGQTYDFSIPVDAVTPVGVS